MARETAASVGYVEHNTGFHKELACVNGGSKQEILSWMIGNPFLPD